MNLKNLTDDELINFYGKWINELKERKIIRSKNVVGDIGEFIAVRYYNTHPNLPKMQLAMQSSANIDAISRNGERYSIKTATRGTTGVFYGFNPPDSLEEQPKVFEYVIIVILNENYTLKQILEIDYETFLKNKKWHKRMSAWNLSITKKLISEAKIIYDNNN